MPSKLYKFPRNEDHVLICDHGKPLHGDCEMCDIDKAFKSHNTAINYYIVALLLAAIAVFVVAFSGVRL